MNTFFADLELGSRNLEVLTDISALSHKTLSNYTSSAIEVTDGGQLPVSPGLYVMVEPLKFAKDQEEPKTYIKWCGPSNTAEWITSYGAEGRHVKGAIRCGGLKYVITRYWLEIDGIETAPIYMINDEGCQPRSRKRNRN